MFLIFQLILGLKLHTSYIETQDWHRILQIIEIVTDVSY